MKPRRVFDIAFDVVDSKGQYQYMKHELFVAETMVQALLLFAGKHAGGPTGAQTLPSLVSDKGPANELSPGGPTGAPYWPA